MVTVLLQENWCSLSHLWGCSCAQLLCTPLCSQPVSSLGPFPICGAPASRTTPSPGILFTLFLAVSLDCSGAESYKKSTLCWLEQYRRFRFWGNSETSWRSQSPGRLWLSVSLQLPCSTLSVSWASLPGFQQNDYSKVRSGTHRTVLEEEKLHLKN